MVRRLDGVDLQIAGDLIDQFVSRSEILLLAGDQVFDATAQCFASGIATQFHDVRASARM